MKRILVGVVIVVNLFIVSHAQAICTGAVFNDVDVNTVGEFFCDFIERFRALEITSGCVADIPRTLENEAQYCPNDNVTRSQMAVFVTRAIEKVTTKTPQQIALLKWYEVNQSAQFFPGGSQPWAMAFDGAHIWVTNRISDNVIKLRASDGANLGTFVGFSSPRGIAFDGANVWVTNVNENNVTKLRVSDGLNLGVFTVTDPFGIAFDGANIWVTNFGIGSVSKL
jgi:DNA-binding beta-propeller fold protein YncE